MGKEIRQNLIGLGMPRHGVCTMRQRCSDEDLAWRKK